MRFGLPFGAELTPFFQEDPAAMLEIKEDIRDECAKVGTVTNVVLYDQEPDGVASVRYSAVEFANACVRVRAFLAHVCTPLCITRISSSVLSLSLSSSCPTSIDPTPLTPHLIPIPPNSTNILRIRR